MCARSDIPDILFPFGGNPSGHSCTHPRWVENLELGKVILQSSVSQLHLGSDAADVVLDNLNQCEKTALYRQDVFEE